MIAKDFSKGNLTELGSNLKNGSAKHGVSKSVLIQIQPAPEDNVNHIHAFGL